MKEKGEYETKVKEHKKIPLIVNELIRNEKINK